MNTKKKIIALKTIITKEVVRVLRIWPQTIIPPVITTSLYFIIFGGILFKDRNIVVAGENIDYISYLIPGLILMAVINNSYNNTVSSFFINKLHKNIEEVIVSPVPVPMVILGFAFGGIARGFIAALIIFITTMLFVTINIHSVIMTMFVAFLTSMFFSLAGILNAVFAKNFDDISWFPSFILTPMIYLGGVFFSIDMLSGFWKIVAQINPVYHFINIFRYSLIGVGEFSAVSLISIIAANIIIFLLTVLAFKKKMQK